MRLLLAIVAAVCFASSAMPQVDSFKKNFKCYRQTAKGIDFFSISREHIVPFEKPIRDARARLEEFLGSDLAPGAVVVCSSMEQRDSVNEQKVLRMGYKWVIIQLTPEASAQEMLARVKSQSGGQVPPGVLERLRNQTPEIQAAAMNRVVTGTVQRVGYAILTTTLAPDRPFRASRADDVARSPMADWLDVGIVSYSAGGASPNMRLLQERMEEAFPIEDVIVMSRPFVVPGTDGGGGGGGGGGYGVLVTRSVGFGSQANGGAVQAGTSGGVVGGGPSGSAPGGTPNIMMVGPGGGAGRAGRGGALPKDVQDRMMFDAQAASLFSYIIEKGGIEKAKALVRASREKQDLREMLIQPDFLGTDMEKLESDWQAWVKAQKADPGLRILMGPQDRPRKTQPNN